MSGRLSKAAVAAFLIVGFTPGAAQAGTSADTTATVACKMEPGSVTAGGDHTARVITAGSPPTMQEKRRYTDIYPTVRSG